MSKDKVNLTLPEVQLVAEVDCDEVECSIEILDHKFRSFNLFDVQNRKFFVTFDAQVKISFYFRGREESIVVTAEEFEVSSVDVIGDGIYSFDFEESTISKDELYQMLKGSEMTVCFCTITH